MNGPRKCGQPTKAKTPCKNIVVDWKFGFACTQHETPLMKRTTAYLWKAYNLGLKEAQVKADDAAQGRINRLEHEVQMLQGKVAKQRRRVAPDGSQIVECDGYAYTWKGSEPLQVGDRVALPANWLFGPSEKVVTDLGTEYPGELQRVLRKVVDN